MELAILIPSILDQECIQKFVKKTKKHILEINNDIRFNIFVNIEPHQRENTQGTLVSIFNLFQQLNYKNSIVDIQINGSNKFGQVLNIFDLYQRFLKSRIQNCLCIDEDEFAQFNLNFYDFINYQNNNKDIIFLFAHTKATSKSPIEKNLDESLTRFLPENIVFESNELIACQIHMPKGNIFMQPGSVLCREQVIDILKEYNKDDYYVNSEDQIMKSNFIKSKKILGVCKKTNEKFVSRECHPFLDDIRCFRRVGFLG